MSLSCFICSTFKFASYLVKSMLKVSIKQSTALGLWGLSGILSTISIVTEDVKGGLKCCITPHLLFKCASNLSKFNSKWVMYCKMATFSLLWQKHNFRFWDLVTNSHSVNRISWDIVKVYMASKWAPLSKVLMVFGPKMPMGREKRHHYTMTDTHGSTK